MPDLDLRKYSESGAFNYAQADELHTQIETEVNSLRARLADAEATITELEPFGMRYLGKAVASGATSIEFTGITDAYDEYIFRLVGLKRSAGSMLMMRTSSNNGSSYDDGTNDYRYSLNFGAANGTAFTSFQLSIAAAVDGLHSIGGTVTLHDPADDGGAVERLVTATITGRIEIGRQLQGCRAGSVLPINAVQFKFSAGTITGTIKMFGVNKGA